MRNQSSVCEMMGEEMREEKRLADRMVYSKRCVFPNGITLFLRLSFGFRNIPAFPVLSMFAASRHIPPQRQHRQNHNERVSQTGLFYSCIVTLVLQVPMCTNIRSATLNNLRQTCCKLLFNFNVINFPKTHSAALET